MYSTMDYYGRSRSTITIFLTRTLVDNFLKLQGKGGTHVTLETMVEYFVIVVLSMELEPKWSGKVTPACKSSN